MGKYHPAWALPSSSLIALMEGRVSMSPLPRQLSAPPVPKSANSPLIVRKKVYLRILKPKASGRQNMLAWPMVRMDFAMASEFPGGKGEGLCREHLWGQAFLEGPISDRVIHKGVRCKGKDTEASREILHHPHPQRPRTQTYVSANVDEQRSVQVRVVHQISTADLDQWV